MNVGYVSANAIFTVLSSTFDITPGSPAEVYCDAKLALIDELLNTWLKPKM